MKNSTELNKIKFPEVHIDPSLSKYENIVLFPEKLAKANEHLEKTDFLKAAEKIEKQLTR